MKFHKRKTETLPPVGVGLCADESGQVYLTTLCLRTRRLLSSDAAASGSAERVTTTLTRWGAHTHPVELRVPRFADEGDAGAALVGIAERGDAETQKFFGTRQSEQVAYDFTRDTERNATYLTVALREDVSGAARDDGPAVRPSAVEPRTHAIWRAARELMRTHVEARGDSPSPTVAVLAVSRSGFGIAIGHADLNAPVYSSEETNEEAHASSAGLSESVHVAEAAQSFGEMLTAASLAELMAQEPVVCFVACEAALWVSLRVELEIAVEARIRPLRTAEIYAHDGAAGNTGEAPADNANSLTPDDPFVCAAYGAALAAGGDRSAKNSSVNLYDPLAERIVRLRHEHEAAHLSRRRTQRRRTAQVMLCAPLLVLSCQFGLWCATLLEVRALARERQHEQARGAELQRYIRWHEDATQIFNFYQELAKQIFVLRDRQPAAARLLRDLDRAFPVGDETWFVSGLQTIPGSNNQIEIRGRTRSPAAVTSFTRALEFEPAGAFTDIQPTTGEMLSGGVAAAQSASLKGAGQAAAPGARGGVYEWMIRARYGAQTPGASLEQTPPLLPPVANGNGPQNPAAVNVSQQAFTKRGGDVR